MWIRWGILLLFLLVAGCSKRPEEPEKVGPWLWERNCIRCHGAHGEGTQRGKTLQGQPITREQVLKQLDHPTGGMPRFTFLTDEDRGLLVEFLEQNILGDPDTVTEDAGEGQSELREPDRD